MKVKRATISLPAELMARIDHIRGDVPRSRWLRRLAEAEVKREAKRSARAKEKQR